MSAPAKSKWRFGPSMLLVAACASSGVATPPTPARPARSTGDAGAAPATSGPGAPSASSSEPAPVAAASSSAWVAPRIDVVYWATPQEVVDKMLELAQLRSSDVIYDLGCGDARSLVTAAQRYGSRGFGFDIDPRRVEEARENVRRNGVEALVQIEQADIFTLDLSPATVVFLFLLPRLNMRLMPQLEKLRRGSRIVSHEFDMSGAKPNKTIRVSGSADGPPGTQSRIENHTLYLWKVPWQKQANATPKSD